MKLQNEITAKIRAYLQKAETLSAASEISKVTKFEGLEQHEVVCLAALAENLEHPEDNASVYQIKRDMEASGFTKVASTIAIASLLQKRLLEKDQYPDHETGDYYTGYTLTGEGWKWILANKDKFVLQKPESKDDIPF